ncbi:MAG: TlpA family protein disulfide reductase [Acidobacteria bacterium]|nr:MAG: TlpA family protein disulfide reductase [Acidobacteriota bacterium]MCL4288271.1 TlpA family protein disulfide reductase [Thermoleophilia bacterium]GIK77032.1 MAG: membrane protein [Actinomycetes bacterium]
MSNRGFIAILGAIAFVALLGFGLLAKGAEDVAVGEPAPDAPMPRLDGSGETRIADYRGSWVLVNFWASWCRPCEEESPAIEAFANRNRDRLVVLGINSEDNSVDANDFIDRYGLSWRMVEDDGERMETYGVLGLPESFLVDPNGDLALIQRGPVDERFLAERVEPLVRGATVEP